MARRRTEPAWLSRVVIDAIQSDQIREHGGLRGVRDENALESALARPKHKWQHASKTDFAMLAAAYGFGLVRNHPYRDGTKRVGFLGMATFLGINGFELLTTDADVVAVMLALADGSVSEASLAAWVRQHIVQRK